MGGNEYKTSLVIGNYIHVTTHTLDGQHIGLSINIRSNVACIYYVVLDQNEGAEPSRNIK
jgi:hypothetical protein